MLVGMFPAVLRQPRRLSPALALVCAFGAASAGGLEEELGRSEVRVRSEPYPLVAGRTVAETALLERLDRLDYERVKRRPERPGRFFFGHDVFWIYRRAHRAHGKSHAAALVGLRLRRGDGLILGGVDADGVELALDRPGLSWLEPETLSESLEGDRADRVPISLEALPDHVWQSVLAAEDTRFFEHGGVDAKSVARAALANLRAGGVVQGGSTITQQLIKNRDLTPKRTLGRKVSEAVRALALEADYDKREILQAYLNQVYLGHVEGLAVHGIGAAARVYYSKRAAELTLAEAATLAAMIQGPNRLSPVRHPERVLERRNWVLGRMQEQGWASGATLRAAADAGLALRPSPPAHRVPRHFLDWAFESTREKVPGRLVQKRGVVLETTLDPWLQFLAERSVRRRLERIRRDHRRLRNEKLSAVLVALDADSGAVLAYVGGDPDRRRDEFDRARSARRQPGSTAKSLVLLEAFESCGGRDPLHPSSRVADDPLQIDLPSGAWSPENYDGRYRGTLDVRAALVDSLNVPFVRIARWCGFERTARRLKRSGLKMPPDPPPSFALGSVETTPLELAAAYTVFATPGTRLEPHPLRRIEKPGGDTLARVKPRRKRVVHPSTAYLIRSLLTSAVESGTARGVAIDGLDVAAKTGSTSGLRDAWLVGHAGSLVTVAWVGLDDGGRLGLTGSKGAGPMWREFMAEAVPARSARTIPMPSGVVERHIDPRTGLLVRSFNPRARTELFRRAALPPRARFWRKDSPVPVVW
jgi:penicillin-binding protein 1B